MLVSSPPTHISSLPSSSSLPPDSAALLVVDLDEFPEAAGVVVVGRLRVTERLEEKDETQREK